MMVFGIAAWSLDPSIRNLAERITTGGIGVVALAVVILVIIVIS